MSLYCWVMKKKCSWVYLNCTIYVQNGYFFSFNLWKHEEEMSVTLTNGKKNIETTWPLPRHGRLALVFSCILYILNILYASLCPRRTLFRLKHKNNKKSTSNSFLFVVRIFFIGSANNFSTDTPLSLIKIKTKGHNLHKFDLC